MEVVHPQFVAVEFVQLVVPLDVTGFQIELS
jgi:hypothetical protein